MKLDNIYQEEKTNAPPGGGGGGHGARRLFGGCSADGRYFSYSAFTSSGFPPGADRTDGIWGLPPESVRIFLNTFSSGKEEEEGW